MFPLWEAGNSGVLGRSRQVLEKRRCSVTFGPVAAPPPQGPVISKPPPPPHPPTGSLAQSGEACHPLLGKRQLYPIPQFLGSDRNPPDFSRAAPHHLWAQLLSTLLAEVYGTILILTTGDLGCLFLLSNIFFR